jgi:hypothetical protein
LRKRLRSDLVAKLATDAQLCVIGDLLGARLTKHVGLTQQAVGILLGAGAGLVELLFRFGAQAGYAALGGLDAGFHRRGADHYINAGSANGFISHWATLPFTALTSRA